MTLCILAVAQVLTFSAQFKILGWKHFADRRLPFFSGYFYCRQFKKVGCTDNLVARCIK